MRQFGSKRVDVFLLDSAKEEIFSLPVEVKAKLGKLIDELSLFGFLIAVSLLIAIFLKLG